MFNVRSAWGALGVMLSLIALYLLLENAGGASTIMRTAGAQTNNIFRTLQGRGAVAPWNN